MESISRLQEGRQITYEHLHQQHEPSPDDLAAIPAAEEDKWQRAARNAKAKRLNRIEWETHDQDHIDQRKAELAKTHGLSYRSAKRPTWDQLSSVVDQNQSWLDNATRPCKEAYKEELKKKNTEEKEKREMPLDTRHQRQLGEQAIRQEEHRAELRHQRAENKATGFKSL